MQFVLALSSELHQVVPAALINSTTTLLVVRVLCLSTGTVEVSTLAKAIFGWSWIHSSFNLFG